MLVSGKLVRLSPEQAEFHLLNVMLASLPTFQSALTDPAPSAAELARRQDGYSVDFLRRNVDVFPERVLREARRRRTYFNHLLARAEVDSAYVPARRLWKRVRQGHYVINPDLQVKLKMTTGQDSTWVDVSLLTDPVVRAWLARTPGACRGRTETGGGPTPGPGDARR